MKFYCCLLAVKDPDSVKPDLIQFKKKMIAQGEFTVISVPQENYDFLYNSLIEQANRGR